MFDILNHYWAVATNPGFVYLTGSTHDYVADNDVTYLAWLAADVTPANVATPIDTEALLWEVFDNYNKATWKWSANNATVFSDHTTLANPLAGWHNLFFSVAGKTVTLPPVRRPGTIPIGYTVIIWNGGARASRMAFALADSSGGSLNMPEVRPDDIVQLTLLTNSTPVGSWGTTIARASPDRLQNQSGTSYTVKVGDYGLKLTFTNAAAIAVTLPQATSAAFGAGWWCDVATLATSGGAVTITPTTSTIDGVASLTIPPGRGGKIVSDGINYFFVGDVGLDLRVPGGRLSLVTATPVMMSTQSAKTTIYYTPFLGGFAAPLWNGVTTRMVELGSELSLALDSDSGHTGYHQSGKNFDLFLVDDGGTRRLVSGPAWTDDTTRATALAYKNGFLTNDASMTARFGASAGNTITVAQYYGLYVGTFRASADGQTQFVYGGSAAGGSAASFLLLNHFNKVPISTFVQDSNGAITSGTTDAFRSSDNSDAMRVSALFNADDACEMKAVGMAAPGVSMAPSVGLGLDSTTTNATGVSRCSIQGGIVVQLTASYYGFPGVGFHYFQMMEYATPTASTYYGSVNTRNVNGLHGRLRM